MNAAFIREVQILVSATAAVHESQFKPSAPRPRPTEIAPAVMTEVGPLRVYSVDDRYRLRAEDLRDGLCIVIGPAYASVLDFKLGPITGGVESYIELERHASLDALREDHLPN